MKQFISLFVICLFHFLNVAQTSVNGTGGEATGLNGQMSFSVGEIVYTTMSNSNNIITQGVQQPYIPPFNYSISASSPIICEGENTTISITIE
jgi:hypothetical protein